MAEYTEYAQYVLTWTKSYTYLGDSLLSTVTPNGAGGEATEYNHPDRLGTRLITNQTLGTVSEQAHLPFGRPLNAESSLTTNNKRFTSYDRSAATGLDYAINRTYDSKQGRFTQVDPIGMQAVSLASPQTLNLYAYCSNDPINHTDPDGLFFKKLFKWISKILKIVAIAVIVAVVIMTGPFAPASGTILAKILGGIVWLGAKVGMAANFISGGALLSAEAVAIGVVSAALGAATLLTASSALGAIANSFTSGKKETPEQRRNRLIRSAINSALWRLRNMPGCKEYIQGNSSHNPIVTLEYLKANNGVIYDSTLGSRQNSPVAQVYGTDIGKGPNSKIRLGDKWFDDPSVGGWKGTMNRPRTMTNILLHELKHAVHQGHGPKEPNNEYYNEIAKKCFGINP